MKEVFQHIDIDEDRQISKAEFAGLMGNAEAVVALHEVGVDPAGLVDFVDEIFAAEGDQEAFRIAEVVQDEHGQRGVIESAPQGRY